MILKQIPYPSEKEIKKYLTKWKSLKKYQAQESAVREVFCTYDNKSLRNILIKVAILNDFYSTNIWDTHNMAEHILSINNLDKRLKKGDQALVDEIGHTKGRYFYSFASKFCSHHNETQFAIYDSYVDKVLRHFRNQDKFSKFRNEELRKYEIFINILFEFIEFYELSKYTLKDIDIYLWLLGKEYFHNNY